MISINNVTKKFDGKMAVKNLSLEVADGDTVVLLGTSGCGKTTTLRLINRLLEPTEGTVSVRGKNVRHRRAEDLRRDIGYVLQHHGLFPHYTIKDNISVVPKLLKWNTTVIEDRISQLIDKLQLPLSLLSQYPHQLSGGQQQRVGLARGLAANPPILLMDEPFGALDPITRAGIRQEFANLDELKNKTIVMVTHDVQEAFELGDQIYIMDNGEIVDSGTPKSLLFKSSCPFTKTFIHQQRLQLEWRAVTLNDLWPHLPPSTTEQKHCTLAARSTMWQIIEALNERSLTRLVVEKGGELKEVNIENLTSAFELYKQQGIYE